jgi:hypothetical protein
MENERCITLTSSRNGDSSTYTAARVGIGDGLWVDNDGILYSQNYGRFMPSYLVSSLFNKLREEDFNWILKVPTEKPNVLENVTVHRIGKRDLMVDKKGRLYDIVVKESDGFIGKPLASCNEDPHSDSKLYNEAYKIARLKHDLFESQQIAIKYNFVPRDGSKSLVSEETQ